MTTRHIFPALILLAATASPMAVAAPVAPDQVARETADKTLREVTARRDELRSNPRKLYALVEKQILPHFDFDHISRTVLGKHWKAATPEQRERFGTAFQSMLIRSYSHALLEYDSERIEWSPVRMSTSTRDVVVRSNVVRKEGPPIPVSYNVHLKSGQWLVYDVTIDSMSLVTNYRGAFANEINRNGVDSLIARLEQKQAAVPVNANP